MLLSQFEVAACHRDTKTALGLIDQGLDTKEVDEYGNSALALAARFGMSDVFKALISHGADVHLRVGNDSILGFAIQSKNVEDVAFLLAHGVGANEPLDDNNLTPLMEASKRGQTEVVTLLLANGADVKAHSNDGIDAVAKAADYGHADIIALLIDNGADPNRPGLNGTLPLNWAARAGYLDAVKMLVQKGAKPDAPSGSMGMTPLADACEGAPRKDRDQVGVIQFLLQNGAKVSAPNIQGAPPLMRAAASYGRVDIMKVLISAGADIHSEDGEGAKAFRAELQTPGAQAPQSVQALLEIGANPHWQVNGYSALFYSIEIRPNADIVAALARANADINETRSQSPMGEFGGSRPPDYVYSALIAAVKTGSVPMVKALLEAGANVRYKDSEGKTALDRAREKGKSEMIALLAKDS